MYFSYQNTRNLSALLEIHQIRNQNQRQQNRHIHVDHVLPYSRVAIQFQLLVHIHSLVFRQRLLHFVHRFSQNHIHFVMNKHRPPEKRFPIVQIRCDGIHIEHLAKPVAHFRVRQKERPILHHVVIFSLGHIVRVFGIR